MRFLIAIVLIFAFLISSAQTKSEQAKANFDQGKMLYDQQRLAEAIPFFEAAHKMDETNPETLYHLGLTLRNLDQNEKALIYFKKLEALNPNYWAWFYYEAGLAYERLGKPDDAAQMYAKFLDKFPNTGARIKFRHNAQYKMKYAKDQKALLAMKPSMKEPIKLSGTINTKYPEYMPALDPTGTKLYFTSKRLGGISQEVPNANEGDEDLYYIEKINGKWGEPKLLPEPLNSISNEGAACFSADGQTMIYTACAREGGIGNCDLYIATLEGNEWTKPFNLGNVVNSDAWDSQPSMSFDGNRIIFASGRQGGYGAEDLFMLERNVFGEWGPPMNLGGMVNTPFSDHSPFLAQDGKTLYFASNGHPGYGGYDLFKTVLENGRWTTPVNLGKPVNTTGDDNYFTIGGSGEIGYFSSNREGQEDLYQIDIPENMRPQPTVVVEGVVTNLKNNEKLGAYVMVEDLNTGELIAVNKSNNISGKYLVVLPIGRTYSVSANKEGFFFHSERFDVPMTSRYQDVKKDIGLKPIEKGAKVVLNNIFFETGKATLTLQSRLELEKAIQLMKSNQTMIIEVGGHTDNVGEHDYNLKLSHERAKAVREYLVNGGIPAIRLQSKGYGESSPIAANDSEEGRQLNRRTEFIILEF